MTADEDVRTKLAPFLARAREECPELELSDRAFLDYLGAVRPLAELAALDNVHAGDLRLAAGCVLGTPRALELLEARYFADLRAAVRSVDSDASFGDEVLQELRHKLAVGDDDGRPRLAQYRGSGPLGGWLRIVALREALGKRRRHWREIPDDGGFATLADAMRTPEQDLAFREHEAVLQRALRGAVAAQPSRARALLRYYYGDGAGVEDLGRLYRVHASTVSRWLAQARQQILIETRRRLAEALGRSEGHVESMLGLARSLEVSLNTLLRSSSSGD
jgi:RNA polymerase sigma-70 factor, ECF subfamily